MGLPDAEDDEASSPQPEFPFAPDDIDDDVTLTASQSTAVVRRALTEGVDLRLYSHEVEQQLEQAEKGAVVDYLQAAPELTALHSHLSQCDSILSGMSAMLSGFQADLGVVSGEIAALQQKSTAMNVKLNNRREAERALFTFIQHVYIPEQLALQLIDGEVNEQYIPYLHSLHQRILYIQQQLSTAASSPSPRHSQAVLDSIPSLLRLKLKAIARIRVFLLERFHALQKPKTNIQIKQKLLVKYRYFYDFLLYHTDAAFLASSSTLSSPVVPTLDVDLAAELRQHYQQTMSHLYSHKFRQYLASLTALQQPGAVEKTDVLGSEESWMRVGVTGLFASRKSVSDIGRAFVLGGRETVLQDANDIIIPHIAEREGKKYGFERLYKSSQQLLMDTATSEYDFIVEFFGERMAREGDRAGLTEDEWMKERSSGSSSSSGVVGIVSGPNVGEEERGREGLHPHSRDKPLFHAVFSSTIALFIGHLDAYVQQCHDCLSILLLIRLLCQHNLQMQYRRVHCVDSVFDRMNMMLWPRFKALFDAHVASIMRIAFLEVKPGKLVSGVAQGYQRPLFVSQRYANLASAIHRLNRPWNDDILAINLRRLRVEVEKLIQRTAARIAVPKAQVVFLINQYQHIISVMTKEGMGHDSEDVQQWSDACKAQIGLFAEEELSEKFKQLIAFVRQTEATLHSEQKQQQQQQQQQHQAASGSSSSAQPSPASSGIDLTSLEPIVKHFAKYWRVGIEQINASVRLHFSDEADGSVLILQTIFVQLLLYYQRLSKIVREYARNKPNIIKDLIPSNTISYAVRKYIDNQPA